MTTGKHQTDMLPGRGASGVAQLGRVPTAAALASLQEASRSPTDPVVSLVPRVTTGYQR